MTTLAKELGVTASALYNHAESKAEILDWLRQTIFAEIDLTSFDTKDWVTGLEDWAHSYRNVVREHRTLLQALASTPSAGPPTTWRMYERVTVALTANGWPLESCLPLIESIEAFIFGSVVKDNFHQHAADHTDAATHAPTFLAALNARPTTDTTLAKEAYFRTGFYSVLTWNAEQLGIDISRETAPRSTASEVRTSS